MHLQHGVCNHNLLGSTSSAKQEKEDEGVILSHPLL